jgi:hypothetical protein
MFRIRFRKAHDTYTAEELGATPRRLRRLNLSGVYLQVHLSPSPSFSVCRSPSHVPFLSLSLSCLSVSVSAFHSLTLSLSPSLSLCLSLVST